MTWQGIYNTLLTPYVGKKRRDVSGEDRGDNKETEGREGKKRYLKLSRRDSHNQFSDSTQLEES